MRLPVPLVRSNWPRAWKKYGVPAGIPPDSAARANEAAGNKGRGAVGADLAVEDQRTGLAGVADAGMKGAVLHLGGKLRNIALGAAGGRAGDPSRPPSVVGLRFRRRCQDQVGDLQLRLLHMGAGG